MKWLFLGLICCSVFGVQKYNIDKQTNTGIWVYCWSDTIEDYVCRGQFNSIEHAKEYIGNHDCYIIVDGKRENE